MDDVPILKMSHWHVGPVGPGSNGGFIRPPDLDIAALQGAIVTTSEIPGKPGDPSAQISVVVVGL